MANGSGKTTDGAAAPGAAPVEARRGWRLPVEREPEKPDFAVIRRLI